MSVIAFQEIFSSPSSSSSSKIEKPYSFTALLIHGLLGCRDDFVDFANSLLSSLSTDWRMVVVDLRCHGRSVNREGLSPPHDIANTARDLANLVKSLNWAWPDVVIGHSVGGKVALQYALSCAQGDYGDSAQLPKQEKSKIKAIMKKWRKLFTQYKHFHLPFRHKKWISSRLKKSGEHMTFSFDIDGVIQMFESTRNSNYWALVEEPPKGIEICVVRSESRVTWDPDVVERLERLASRESSESRGKVSVHVVLRSGHWIYKDEPQRLLEVMTPRIASLVNPISN